MVRSLQTEGKIHIYMMFARLDSGTRSFPFGPVVVVVQMVISTKQRGTATMDTK